MPNSPASAPNRPRVIGHRGAPGHRPEHTESAYRLAFAQGVDAVEPDIVVTRDGVLVIRHENEIGGTTDVAEHPEFANRRTTKTIDGMHLTGWFTEDFTWAELQTLRCRERLPELRPENARHDGEDPILSLEQLCALVDEQSALFGRDVDLVIEIKHAQYFLELDVDIVGLLLSALARSGWDRRPDRLTVECFELAPLESLRDSGLPAQFVFLLESAGAPADEVARHGRRARPFSWFRSDAGLDSLIGRVDGVSFSKRDILADDDPFSGLVARAHHRGLSVLTWTLRPENRFLDRAYRSGKDPAQLGDYQTEWRRIVRSGVDGVFVDYPDLAGEIL